MDSFCAETKGESGGMVFARQTPFSTLLAANIENGPRRTPRVFLPASRNAQASLYELRNALFQVKCSDRQSILALEISIEAL
jgi:hypothetical protein